MNVHCDIESNSQKTRILLMYIFSYAVQFLIKMNTKNPPYQFVKNIIFDI